MGNSVCCLCCSFSMLDLGVVFDFLSGLASGLLVFGGFSLVRRGSVLFILVTIQYYSRRVHVPKQYIPGPQCT